MPRVAIPVRFGALLTALLFVVATAGAAAGIAGFAGPAGPDSPPPRMNHAISGSSSRPAPGAIAAAPETLRVLAVMIEFQADVDARTSGTGNFDLGTTTNLIKDPPPHDRDYFQIHLDLLSKYYRKVSDGKTNVVATLLPDVYRLDTTMRAYSPGRGSTNNAELGKLVDESWRMVDSVTPGIAYDDYDAFVIFHAGVGRDIDLVSIYGFDPTPFDIPSIYMNLRSLRAIYGEGYQGVPVAGGSRFITNSLIIPETESRTVPVIGGNVLLELGINGLLAANIGSHLGLPDLFDTETGRSGIGRFGLMDGQSIFSWFGFIPPEPSAWEKQALGWVVPVVATPGTSVFDLPAAGLPGGADTVVKVPISAGEYFLVENRNRDAARDGQTITMLWGADTLTRTWYRDTTNFNFVDLDSLYGVILDVDDFDWSLPGGVARETSEWFDGGMLIWHIDESVIAANLEAGSVNADPERRGVDLEEADGSQDIGQSYGFISPGAGSEDGTVLDFWYAGNEAPLRLSSNLFGPASNPSSLGNNRTNSHITISGFTARGPRMSATIAVGDSVIAPMPGFPRKTDATFPSAGVTATGDGAFIAVASGSPPRVYGWTTAGLPLMSIMDTSGAIPLPPAVTGLDSLFPRGAVVNPGGTGERDLALAGSIGTGGRLVMLRIADIDNNLLADTVFTVELPRRPTTAPLVAGSFIAVGAEGGVVFQIALDGTSLTEIVPVTGDTAAIASLSLLWGSPGWLTASSAGRIGLAGGLVCPGGGAFVAPDFSAAPVHVASAKFGSDVLAFTFVAAGEDGRVTIVDACGGELPGFPYNAGGPIRGVPAIADLDGDGLLDVVVFAGRRIVALNQAGAPLDGFPVEVPSSNDLSGSPAIADVDGDGAPDIVGLSTEGVLFAYSVRGTALSGFPLQAGPVVSGTPAAFYFQNACLSCTGIGIAATSTDGHLYAWSTGNLTVGPAAAPVQPWPQYARDARNTSLNDTVLTHTSPGGGFLPSSRTYNWPNPVGRDDGYVTHIRYYVPSDASATIRIFDLAGNLVHTVEGLEAKGGLDNEVDWDVSGVESGVYFARIEASGAGGSGSAVVTIAVVK